MKKIRWITGSVNDPDQMVNLEKYLTDTLYYAFIYHDKDVDEHGAPVKKHMHFICESNAIPFSSWSEKLKIPENFICKCLNIRSMHRYLLHLDEKNKHVYNFEEIKTSDYDRCKRFISGEKAEDVNDFFTDLRNINIGSMSFSDFVLKYNYEISKCSFYNKIRIYEILNRISKEQL